MSGAALVVEGVRCSYGGLRSVDDVSFAVAPGEIVALAGPNGAGKTTLLNAISGLHPIDQGRVVLHGRDITGYPAWRRARAGLGRSFQLVRLFGELSVRRNVELGLSSRGAPGFVGSLLHAPRHRRFRRDAAEAARRALDQVGLAELAQRPAADISHGQGRRVEIARAKAGEPSVLLLDEPSSGLHAGAIGELVPVLRATAERGTAIVVVEHNLRFVKRVAGRIIVMDRGRTIADGPPDEVLRQPEVVLAYLGGNADHAALAERPGGSP